MTSRTWFLGVCVGLLVPLGCAKNDEAAADKDDGSKTSAAKKGDSKKKIAKTSKKGKDAKELDQRGGANVFANKTKAKPQGKGSDGGIPCDAALDGLAWCETENQAVFCADGEWYALDCVDVEEGAFCGMDIDTQTVDCFVEDDIGEAVAAAVVIEEVVDHEIGDETEEL
jgi:hypothetical protein